MSARAVAGRAGPLLRALGSVAWRLLAFFGLWGGLLAAVLVPAAPLRRELHAGATLRLRLGMDALGLVTILLATWLLLRFVERRPLADVGVAARHLARDLALGLAIGAAWLGASLAIAFAGGWLVPAPGGGIAVRTLPGTALSTALNVLTQQLLLCGFPFLVLRSRAGFPAALVVSALLFSGYHAGAFHGAWLPALNVLLAGALFLVAREITGWLWLGSGIHFAWNFLLGPVLGLDVSGRADLVGGRLLALRGPPLLCGGAFGIEGGLAVTVTVSVAVAALVAAVRARRPRPARVERPAAAGAAR